MGPHEPGDRAIPRRALRADQDVLEYAKLIRDELYRVAQGARGRDGLLVEWRRVCHMMNERGLELPEERVSFTLPESEEVRELARRRFQAAIESLDREPPE